MCISDLEIVQCNLYTCLRVECQYFKSFGGDVRNNFPESQQFPDSNAFNVEMIQLKLPPSHLSMNTTAGESHDETAFNFVQGMFQWWTIS